MENFGKTSNSCEYRKVVSIMKNDLEEMMYNWKALVTLCACFQKMYVKHNETFIPCHTEIHGRYIKLITHIHRKHTLKK